MKLNDRLHNMANVLQLLQDELAQIKLEAAVLENENDMLKNQISVYSGVDISQLVDNGSKIRLSSRENLEKLYKEGFHICHSLFGSFAEGECLFCRGMLEQGATDQEALSQGQPEQ